MCVCVYIYIAHPTGISPPSGIRLRVIFHRSVHHL